MSPEAGNFLKYKLNEAKINLSYGSIGSIVSKLFPFGGAYMPYVGLYAGAMAWRTDLMINKIEYCSSQGKGMWINSNSYTMFLNLRVRCE
jgi:hypothetical protein